MERGQGRGNRARGRAGGQGRVVRTRGGRGGRRGQHVSSRSDGGDRPSAPDAIFYGMIEDLETAESQIEQPLHRRRARVLPPRLQPTAGSQSLWSSLGDITDQPSPSSSLLTTASLPVSAPPSPSQALLCSEPSPAVQVECGGSGDGRPQSPGPSRLSAKRSRATEESEARPTSLPSAPPSPSLTICSVPSPAWHVECGTSQSPGSSRFSAKRSRVTEESEPGTSKRCLIPSSSTSRRSLRDDDIANILNYGSEEESSDDDNESGDVQPNPILIPRVARLYMQDGDEDEDDNMQLDDAILSFEWPPQPLQPEPNPLPEPEAALEEPHPTPESEFEPEPEAALEEPHPTPESEFEPEPEAALEEPHPTPVQLTPLPEFGPSSKFIFNWRAFSHPQIPPELRRETFSYINCGPTIQPTSPYEAFIAIWDREIMEHIAVETNIYAEQVATNMLETGTLYPQSRIGKWRPTNVDELYVYFAIIIATGIVTKTRLEEYWNKSEDIFSTPGFSAQMSFDRFLLLSRNLHFNNNDNCNPETITRAEAKLYKLQPIVDHLNKKFKDLYVMSRNIALDESLTMWKGWLDINQFIHNKAATVGIKTYEICESKTGYLWSFEVHVGHATSDPQVAGPVSGIIPALVLKLLNGLEHKGYTVWMDNYYNSPALARELKTRGFDCVGTLRTNRQFVPTELTNLKKNDMRPGQICGCTSGDVDIVVWRDKNRVALISTYHGLAALRSNTVLKPSIIPDYNVCMGGVDRKDQMIAMYPMERKRTKIWYKKFFKRLLNVSVLNAYILHKDTNSISHRQFRKSLVCELLQKHGQQRPTPGSGNPTATGGHFPAQYPFIAARTQNRLRRLCVVCKKRTNVYCKACNVPLCNFTCFEPHHT